MTDLCLLLMLLLYQKCKTDHFLINQLTLRTRHMQLKLFSLTNLSGMTVMTLSHFLLSQKKLPVQKRGIALNLKSNNVGDKVNYVSPVQLEEKHMHYYCKSYLKLSSILQDFLFFFWLNSMLQYFFKMHPKETTDL